MQPTDVPESGAPIRVLVVDDHPTMRVGLRSALAESGIQVIADAGNGDAALAALDVMTPDIALVDMLLPLESGVDITKRLLQRRPELKVIAFSMREEPSLMREALAAGARGYVFKRSAPDHFVDAVKQVAAGGSYVDLHTQPTSKLEPSYGLLSDREEHVLRLLARGESREVVAQKLGITPRTVDTYKIRGMRKLELRSRADLMRFASHAGWLLQLHD